MTSTPNFGFNLPAPADSMADVTDSFNLAFTYMNNKMLGPSAGIVAGSVLPQKTGAALPSDYKVGDVIHLTGWKSNFILIAVQADSGTPYWGYVWRPIQAAWSPWVTVQTATYFSANFTAATNDPLRYRVSNQGEIEFTGGMRSFTTVDVPWPKYAGSDQQLFGFAPSAITPAFSLKFAIPLVHPDLTLTNKPYCFANLTVSPFSSIIAARVFNSSVANDGFATQLHFGGVSWPMATRTDLVGS
jgi:hypothetical protein